MSGLNFMAMSPKKKFGDLATAPNSMAVHLVVDI